LPVTSCQYCCGEIVGEGPEGEGGGEDVGVGEGALGVPDGVDGGEQGDSEGRGVAEQSLGEAEDGQQPAAAKAQTARRVTRMWNPKMCQSVPRTMLGSGVWALVKCGMSVPVW
jgi:hypothetical protein